MIFYCVFSTIIFRLKKIPLSLIYGKCLNLKWEKRWIFQPILLGKCGNCADKMNFDCFLTLYLNISQQSSNLNVKNEISKSKFKKTELICLHLWHMCVLSPRHYPKSKTHRRKYDVFDYVEFQYSTQQRYCEVTNKWKLERQFPCRCRYRYIIYTEV